MLGRHAPRVRRRGLLASLALVGTCLLLASGAGASTTLFSDDFNDGNDNGWTQENRFWDVIGGRYFSDGCYGCNGVPTTGGRDAFSFTHIGDPSWTDYTYEFSFETPPGDPQQAMVFFRVQGPLPSVFGAPTEYRADFWSAGQCCHPERVDLTKWGNGSGSDLASVLTSGVIHLGTNRGKVILTGGRIQILVNDVPVVDVVDPDPIPFGGVGVGAIWETATWFDDILVTGGAGTDTTPPQLTTPGDLTVDATGPGGAAVSFTVTAADVDDQAGPVSCNPPSGSTFTIGQTTVTCQSADTHSNTGSAQFTVTVRGAVDQLRAEIAGLAGVGGGSFATQLQAALDAVGANKVQSACGTLAAFANHVQAQAGKQLTLARAAQLFADAGRIGAVLGC
jgi:hypothetical protein